MANFCWVLLPTYVLTGEFWVSINSYFWRVFFLYIPTSEFWCLSGWIHPYAYNHLKFSLHWKNHLRTTTIGIHTTQNCFKIWWMVIAYSKRFTVCISSDDIHFFISLCKFVFISNNAFWETILSTVLHLGCSDALWW